MCGGEEGACLDSFGRPQELFHLLPCLRTLRLYFIGACFRPFMPFNATFVSTLANMPSPAPVLATDCIPGAGPAVPAGGERLHTNTGIPDDPHGNPRPHTAPPGRHPVRHPGPRPSALAGGDAASRADPDW